MNVTSLNIRQGGGARIGRILDDFCIADCDVLAIQEFRPNKAGRQLLEHLEAHGFQCCYPTGIDTKQNTVLIAAKTLEHVPLPNFPNRWSAVGARVKEVMFVNVYFPQLSEKKVVYDWFLKYGRSLESTVIIGDFNTGRNDLDLQGGSKFHCEAEFRTLSEEMFVDVYRYLKGDRQEYSWYSYAGNGFRIDHALCTSDLVSRMCDIFYDHATRDGITDHSSLKVKISD